jgi:hypothetical protein
MYLVEVQLELYIFHPKGNGILSSVATNQRAGLQPTPVLMLSVCARCSQLLLLPLAIVSVCAGVLVAYLCRAARDQQAVSEPYKRRHRTNRWR